MAYSFNSNDPRLKDMSFNELDLTIEKEELESELATARKERDELREAARNVLMSIQGSQAVAKKTRRTISSVIQEALEDIIAKLNRSHNAS